jgi:hypothetical protein
MRIAECGSVVAARVEEAWTAEATAGVVTGLGIRSLGLSPRSKRWTIRQMLARHIEPLLTSNYSSEQRTRHRGLLLILKLFRYLVSLSDLVGTYFQASAFHQLLESRRADATPLMHLKAHGGHYKQTFLRTATRVLN